MGKLKGGLSAWVAKNGGAKKASAVARGKGKKASGKKPAAKKGKGHHADSENAQCGAHELR